MAEHKRTFYTCDRCGCEMEQPVCGGKKGPTAVTLSASLDYGVTGGTVIDWKHLCAPCNGKVLDIVSDLMKTSREMRKERA